MRHMNKDDLASILDGNGSWGKTFMNTIILLVSITIISFSLDTVDDLNQRYGAIFYCIEYACVFIFTVEYILRVYVASSRIHYIMRLVSIIDLVAVCPSWVALFFPSWIVPHGEFLRMIRLFKFLVSSPRGNAAASAFWFSWKENYALHLAAAYVGICLWCVTSSLQYFIEKDNPNLLWCYPDEFLDRAQIGATPSSPCLCDEQSCSGTGCRCVHRYGSIPSSMYFTLLELSGKYPLANKHSTAGRLVTCLCALLSVGMFAIPSGLFAAALENSVKAIKYHEMSQSTGSPGNTEVVDEADRQQQSSKYCILDINSPSYMLSEAYALLSKCIIVVSALCSILSTVSGVPDSAVYLFFVADVIATVVFGAEQVLRLVASKLSAQAILHSFCSSILPIADTLSWIPSVVWIFSCGGISPPAYLSLSVSLFRIFKLERWNNGLTILGKVLHQSWSLLCVGGMATLCIFLFSSTLMFHLERWNPDPNMRKFYGSVPASMWMTLLNMSGNMPIVDYTLSGRVVECVLSFVAVAVFAFPVGAIRTGFQLAISDMARYAEMRGVRGQMNDDLGDQPYLGEEEFLLSSSNNVESDNHVLRDFTSSKLASYGGLDSIEKGSERVHDEDATISKRSETISSTQTAPHWLRFCRKILANPHFYKLSVWITLISSAVEILSTCQLAISGKWGVMLKLMEFAVVLWFTQECILHTLVQGRGYFFSWIAFLDIITTFPWFLAHGILGGAVAKVVDLYDGPIRALRLLRLLRLDSHTPSLSLIYRAIWSCKDGLLMSLYFFLVLWFMFNEWLFLSERNDLTYEQTTHFRSALSSLQFSGVLLTGSYPFVGISMAGQICCSTALVTAVGIAAAPASILASSFIDILQESEKVKRDNNISAIIRIQRLYRKKKYLSRNMNGVAHLLIHRRHERSLSTRVYRWWSGRTLGARAIRYGSGLLIVGNVCGVIICSMPSVERQVPLQLWNSFELFSVVFFTLEYALNIYTAPHSPDNFFSRRVFIFSFAGLTDLISILPFYIANIILPLVDARVPIENNAFRILRMFRLTRILKLDRHVDVFRTLDKVWADAEPVLKATGVVALVVWIGCASVLYYSGSSSKVTQHLQEGGGENVYVFASIPDALYQCSLALAGDWEIVDLSPIGSIVYVVLSLFGVALFTIPVGVFFEGFQNNFKDKK